MSLNCPEVRELIKELDFVIDTTSLVNTDTPFLSTSPTSVTNKSKTVDDQLGEISCGILSLLYSTSHIRVFGMEDNVIRGSREMKGNVPILHHGVMDLFDMLTTVVHMIDTEEEKR